MPVKVDKSSSHEVKQLVSDLAVEERFYDWANKDKKVDWIKERRLSRLKEARGKQSSKHRLQRSTSERLEDQAEDVTKIKDKSKLRRSKSLHLPQKAALDIANDVKKSESEEDKPHHWQKLGRSKSLKLPKKDESPDYDWSKRRDLTKCNSLTCLAA